MSEHANAACREATGTEPVDDPRVPELAKEYMAELERGRGRTAAGISPGTRTWPRRSRGVWTGSTCCTRGRSAGRVRHDRCPVGHGPGRRRPARRLRDRPRDRPRRHGRGLRGASSCRSAGGWRSKVLPAGRRRSTRQQLQRFQTEAQAAAHLHHTNIVPVHAVGCERGVHYYAMQYIDGLPLDAFIRDLRGAEGRAGGSTSTMDLRAGPTAPGTSRGGIDLSTGPARRETYRTAGPARRPGGRRPGLRPRGRRRPPRRQAGQPPARRQGRSSGSPTSGSPRSTAAPG